ncbi:hypothetical protein DERF_013429 [Dermatophagoides farinae]|uniref:Uncharacterized protein n=1 Tax=Dermatophagoides farinae TaxID=6954 RepID=A0A922HME8_DERFA|nr:hypothetical protein DERF_013429 [Dermatophagoides farinae]
MPELLLSMEFSFLSSSSLPSSSIWNFHLYRFIDMSFTANIIKRISSKKKEKKMKPTSADYCDL